MPDGRVVAVGSVGSPTLYGYTDFGVVRLTANGQPDPTFGTNGLATVGFDLGGFETDTPKAIAVRPDGGVIVVGSAATARSGGLAPVDNAFAVAVAVFTPDGKLDPAFKTDGKISFLWPDTPSSSTSDVHLLPDGSFIVAGSGGLTTGGSALAAAQLRPDGTFDPAYGQGGMVSLPVTGSFSFHGVDIDPAGGVVGLFSRREPLQAVPQTVTYTLTRLSPAGAVDRGFGTDGTAVVKTVTYNGPPESGTNDRGVTATPDGRLLVSFTATTSSMPFLVSNAGTSRFLANGAADPAFGPGGQRAGFTIGETVGLPDGRVFIGADDLAFGNGNGVIRHAADGSLDPSFGVGGTVSSMTLREYGVTGAVLEATPDGGVVLFGRSEAGPLVAVRLLGDIPLPAIKGLAGVTAVGPGPGGGTNVALRSADGADAGVIQPFGPVIAGGVRVATADVNGDGTIDLVAGTGPGWPTRVRVLDGVTRRELFAVDPFEASFTGGVYVAAGDTNADGVPDLVITPDEGGGPRVRVFDGKTFGLVADFFGIDDPNFRGGARSAIGDMNGDGFGDLVVAAGFQGGPRVAAFSGKSLGSTPVKLFNDFFAFEQTLRNGVFIATGDIDGDGKAEIIAGGGPGGGPRVTAFSAAALTSSGGGTLTPGANFFGGDPNNRGGIRLAVKNLDGDGRADLVVGAGAGAGSRVTAYLGKSIAPAGTPAAEFDFDAFPGFTNSVFVG